MLARPKQSAFTLVEAMTSLSLAAIAGAAIMTSLYGSLHATETVVQQSIAGGLAQQLLDEALSKRYLPPAGNPLAYPLGQPQATSSPRTSFDEIGDFNGYMAQPPCAASGVGLGHDDAQLPSRHPNFEIPQRFLDQWRQEVEVYYVSDADPALELSAGSTSYYRAVEVRIMRDDPTRGTRQLAKARRIVAYFPTP